MIGSRVSDISTTQRGTKGGLQLEELGGRCGGVISALKPKWIALSSGRPIKAPALLVWGPPS